jgi:hypothetical protein
MPRTSGSTAAQTAARIEAALALLVDGVELATARRQLESQFSVDSSTARRYLREAKAELIEDCKLGDLEAEAGIQVERLRSLAYQSRQAGNFNAHILTSFQRNNTMGAARLHGHSVGAVEVTESQRRKYRKRKPADDLPADLGF